MDKLGDMDLFVRVVRNQGLAAAGREAGLSPARMTARMNRLEARYGVRLLHRSTRHVAPTAEGERFYHRCVQILAEIEQAEEQLNSGREALSGPLRVTATSDLGRQHIAPVLAEFVAAHPLVTPYLQLTDGVANLSGEEFDLAIRYGQLPDSRLVARRLARSRRILCASPDYLKQNGKPEHPDELAQHRCLAMVRHNEPLTTWYFNSPDGPNAIAVTPALSCNDGAQIRDWALGGAGIALKSIWDVSEDLAQGRLLTVLEAYAPNFTSDGDANADLHAVFHKRKYLPQRITEFVNCLQTRFAAKSTRDKLSVSGTN